MLCMLQMDIVIGTPLRLAKLAKQQGGSGAAFAGVEFVVLDEADKLLDDGAFLRQTDAILAACTHPRKVRMHACMHVCW